MDSRVTLSADKDAMGIPRPSVSYKLPQYTLDGYAYAMTVADKLFAAANAANNTQVPAFPWPTDPPSPPPPGYLKFTPTDGKKELTVEFRGAGHLIGTCRMGNDPKVSVVNADLRSWDHSNLYLVGSGAFPTTATSNPTLTIAALALRAADKIVADLSQTDNSVLEA